MAVVSPWRTMDPEYTASPGLRSAGSDSPVSADWSTSTGSPSSSRASAGTMSPSLRRMTSPGTSSRATGIDPFSVPLHTGLDRQPLALSAAMALPASRSSQKPTPALASSRRRMMKKSGQCRTTPERITATSIIHGIGPQK